MTLKKLTLLVSTFLKWDEMQIIGLLTDLEFLKSEHDTFCGEQWETNDGRFRRLKHSASKFIKIGEWTARDSFGIGDIYTLDKLEPSSCAVCT